MNAEQEKAVSGLRECVKAVDGRQSVTITGCDDQSIGWCTNPAALLSVIDDAAERLALWEWLPAMACHVSQNSVLGGPNWVVVDVDGEVIGGGMSPVEAIADAKRLVESARE